MEFILANPSFYVELERNCGISRIATSKNKVVEGVYTKFGGVIFCRKQRKDIHGYRYNMVLMDCQMPEMDGLTPRA